ncbi:MAG: dioxygenase alpha subunit yeaW [Schlesneria sp.]|nr:dioxygenase alpha subunit yeaW [Schlesneria sp.]
MFLHQTHLPHLLPPDSYFCPKQYAHEMSFIFRPGWHLVAGVEDLACDGDFVTCTLFDVPLLLRNSCGQLHAFLNVCTHRHCLLTHAPLGNQAKLTCQYHGWEYCDDGSTARIPDARSFRPMPGGPERLRKFALQVRGPLVFVSLADNPRPFEEYFGPLAEPCDEYPVARWRLAAAWEYAFNANWKIPVENTIESYHVPLVHPNSLVNFASEEQIVHEIHPQATVMRTPTLPPAFYRRLSRWVLPWLDARCTVDHYELFHGFPNLFLIRIDAMLQVMAIFPISPTTCRMTVRVYGLRAAKETWMSRWLTWGWGNLKARIVRWVLSEDARLYPDLQRGMECSPFEGTISMREELVFAFQDYVRRQCEQPQVGGTPPFSSETRPGRESTS